MREWSECEWFEWSLGLSGAFWGSLGRSGVLWGALGRSWGAPRLLGRVYPWRRFSGDPREQGSPGFRVISSSKAQPGGSLITICALDYRSLAGRKAFEVGSATTEVALQFRV